MLISHFVVNSNLFQTSNKNYHKNVGKNTVVLKDYLASGFISLDFGEFCLLRGYLGIEKMAE